MKRSEIGEMMNDLIELDNATGFTDTYLRRKGACDSSNRASIRMVYVRSAIEEMRKDILILAAEKCRKDICSVVASLKDQIEEWEGE